jgi:LysM repeat protein
MKSKVLLAPLAAAVLAACGAANGAAPDGTVLGLTSTNYVTVTQTPTTLVPTTIAGVQNPGAVHPEEGTYVIVAGDFPSTIANRFKVTLNDLIAINGWTLANGQVPEFNASPPGQPSSSPNWTEPGAVAATARPPILRRARPHPSPPPPWPAASRRVPPANTRSWRKTPRVKVAKKLDTTVAELDAANANTKGYSGFFPASRSRPPKANC